MEKNIHKYKLFGRRKGRKKNFNHLDKNFLKTILKKNIRLDKINHNILDVGSGSGENSIYLSKNFPRSQIIACDNFEDGNLNLCESIKLNNIKNILIFNGNVLEIFDKITNHVFDSIWILFPDPWPKKRHHKRRLINFELLEKFHFLLKKNGKIFISTDSKSYLLSILKNIYLSKKKFKWENDKPYIWSYNLEKLPETKYYKKAIKLNKSAFFIRLVKI